MTTTEDLLKEYREIQSRRGDALINPNDWQAEDTCVDEELIHALDLLRTASSHLYAISSTMLFDYHGDFDRCCDLEDQGRAY